MRKKITWLADYDLSDHKGGAQQTNQIMIDEGARLGYNINVVKPDNFKRERSLFGDLVITNNITRFGADNINWLIDSVPYVRYSHDYWCLENISLFPQLFEKSLLNIMLSPLHASRYGNLLPRGKTYLQASPVKGFYRTGEKRMGKTILSVGGIGYHKGLDMVLNFARVHDDYKFIFYGWGEAVDINRITRLKNCEYKGEADHKKLLKVYNSVEYFIHLPRWKEPFGRVIIEAYLSGCSIIHNDKVGALSYNWDWNDYEKIKRKNDNLTREFWDKIEDVCLTLQ